MDRNTKRFLYSLFSGVVSVVGLNLYHFRFAIRDKIPIFPLANLYDYEAPLDLWRNLSYYFFYIGCAFIAGACMVEIYRAIKSTVATRFMEKRMK